MGFFSKFFLLLLVLTCISCALAGWILVAINLRKQHSAWHTYSRIDPSFLICSVFAFFWYIVVLLVPAGVAIAITLFFSMWYLGEAIAYTVRKWQPLTRCPHPGFPLPSGCIPLYKSIWSFAWINFGLALILAGYLIFLAVRHSNKYQGESGSETMTWDLCDSKKVRERDQVNDVNEKSLPTGTEAAHDHGTNVESTHVSV